MIRRDPTLIPMTDNDVQDIRDFVGARKREQANNGAETSKTSTSMPVPGFTTQEEAQKKKEAMTKHERLGIA